MPLHRGHMHLIETARKAVDELTVMVCSIQAEPIPGYLRYEWMKKTFPDLRVLHVTDENPQEPKDHRFFWEIWANTFRRNMPKGIDIVFTSENYGQELAKRMNIQHQLVDLDRSTFPVSGTKIRNNPFANWEYIPQAVRPFYLKKIVLTGPESTGKSTLSKKLAAHYKTCSVEEYGRTYWETNTGDKDCFDIAHVAAGQLWLEEQAAERANKMLFCDTDLLVTQIWSEIYYQKCPAWIIQYNHQHKYDLHLLLDIDIPWVDDGTREFPKLRQFHFDRIQEELESRNINYVLISGNYEARFEKAVAAVDALMG